MSEFKIAADKLGVSFKDLGLLAEALTHRSYLNEHRAAKQGHNERLEFLGDAVVELATTHFLFNKFPTKPEGDLTAYRAAMVNTVSLAESAAAMGLGDLLLLSKGESKDTGRAREAILANAFEALTGAIYMDQGYEAAESFIAKHLYPKIDGIVAGGTWQDAKSRFQEAAQEKAGATPAYKTLREEGPDHDKKFTVGVYIRSEKAAEGEGKSKQDAEQAAALSALAAKGW